MRIGDFNEKTPVIFEKVLSDQDSTAFVSDYAIAPLFCFIKAIFELRLQHWLENRQNLIV